MISRTAAISGHHTRRIESSDHNIVRRCMQTSGKSSRPGDTPDTGTLQRDTHRQVLVVYQPLFRTEQSCCRRRQTAKWRCVVKPTRSTRTPLHCHSHALESFSARITCAGPQESRTKGHPGWFVDTRNLSRQTNEPNLGDFYPRTLSHAMSGKRGLSQLLLIKTRSAEYGKK